MVASPHRAYELAERARGAEWLEVLGNHLKIKKALGFTHEPRGLVFITGQMELELGLKADPVDNPNFDVGAVNEASLRKAVQNAALS